MSTACDTAIRPCRESDIPAVVQLVQWAFRGGKPSNKQWTGEEHLVSGPRTTPEKLSALIAASESVVFVLEAGGAIIGCIHVERKHGDGHIGMLAVDPDQQSSGAGRKLMHAAEEHARTAFGCKRMVGEVISGRPELMQWYERLGYRATGETAPFFGPEHGVQPLVEGLHFVLIEKALQAPC